MANPPTPSRPPGGGRDPPVQFGSQPRVRSGLLLHQFLPALLRHDRHLFTAFSLRQETRPVHTGK